MIKKYLIAIGLLFLSSIILTGCLNDDDTDDRDRALIEEYLIANNLQAQIEPNGVYFVPLTTNPSGDQVNEFNVVSIYYSLSLIDGTLLDQHTAADGDPLKLMTGVLAVAPQGLDFGLLQMKTGEVFKLLIPSKLAFGGNSFGQILPANAVIVLDVEVVNVWTVEDHKALEDFQINQFINNNQLGQFTTFESGLYFQETAKGNGELPQDNNTVVVDFKGRFMGGGLFDENDLFIYNVGQDDVIDGFEEGIKNTEFGGESIIFVPSHLGFGESDFIIPRQISAVEIPPFSILRFDLKIRN